MSKYRKTEVEKQERNAVYAKKYKQRKCKECEHKSCRKENCRVCGGLMR